MIEVHFEFENRSLRSLRVQGHQENHGDDRTFGLICNSVSVTVQNFQDSLVNLVSSDDFEFQNRKGLCWVRRVKSFRLSKEKENILEILVKVSLIGLKRLQKHHPEHLKIHLLEN